MDSPGSGNRKGGIGQGQGFRTGPVTGPVAAFHRVWRPGRLRPSSIMADTPVRNSGSAGGRGTALTTLKVQPALNSKQAPSEVDASSNT